MTNRSAGYISSQACPTNPDHGSAIRTERGYYCPHAGHATPGHYTINSWSLDQWEALKNGEPIPPREAPATNAKAPNRRSRQDQRPKRRARRSP